MLQIAIIGLGTLGLRMMEELSSYGAELIIVDKKKELIDKYQNNVKSAYVTDAINEKALKAVIPRDIDAAIIDMGDNFEPAVMTANCLHKLGVKKIIVEAQTDEQGEILKMVGASQIVFPELEAAKRITPILLSSSLFNFMQISQDFAMAEVIVPENLDGKTLMESNLRKANNLNVVAFRKSPEEDFSFINAPTFVFKKDYTILVAGKNEDIVNYLAKSGKEQHLTNDSFFSRLFKKREE